MQSRGLLYWSNARISPALTNGTEPRNFPGASMAPIARYAHHAKTGEDASYATSESAAISHEPIGPHTAHTQAFDRAVLKYWRKVTTVPAVTLTVPAPRGRVSVIEVVPARYDPSLADIRDIAWRVYGQTRNGARRWNVPTAYVAKRYGRRPVPVA